jgi:Asp-tRNA(Asn)/Glu-tRNA(Gln) amidotransferase A subunit family amidase
MTTQLTDAVGTAHAIRDGEVSAREVVEAAIARIEKHDPVVPPKSWRVPYAASRLSAVVS